MRSEHELRVSHVARAANVHVHTLHYYERRGLLPTPRRTTAGHRVNAATHIACLAGFPAQRRGLLPTPRRTTAGHRVNAATHIACLAGFPALTDFTVRNTRVEGSHDVAYVTGRYRLRVETPDGSTPSRRSWNFVQVLRKQVDDSWGIDVHMIHPN